MVLKSLNILFGLLFVVAAALQYNDPDPYIWMPIYLYGALLCALAVAHKYYPWACLVGIMVYGAYAGFLFFTTDGVMDWMDEHRSANIAETMKATKPWIEQTREFFGLLILIVMLFINFMHARRKLLSPGIK